MSTTDNQEIAWIDKPKKHNYEEACDYLKLIFPEKTVKKLVYKLKKADASEYDVKDVMRATKSYHILGDIKPYIEKISLHIQAGKSISPILLVRHPDTGKTIIADGYHRLCAIYLLDPCATVCCKVV